MTIGTAPPLIRTPSQVGLTSPLEEEMLRTHNLADKEWRMNNLYAMLDEQRQSVQFKMRPLQEHFYKRWWWRNILLKSRQIGGCVDPSTRVLTADLKWVAISDMRVGDEIVAVDEFPAGGKGKGRKMRTATVEGIVKYQVDERVLIKFADGREIICTPNHPWLSKMDGRSPVEWRSIDNTRSITKGKLHVGSRVRSIVEPWDDTGYEDGYMAGAIDSDGHISKDDCKGSVKVTFTQQANKVFDRVLKYFDDNGYSPYVTVSKGQHADTYHRNADVMSASIGSYADIFRLLGQCRPEKAEGTRFWEGREPPGKRNHGVNAWIDIVSITSIGAGEVIDLQTSTKTYIAEGLVSHNTTLIELSGLDNCIFIPNFKVMVISHKTKSAEAILEEKALYPYMNLHPELRERVQLVEQNKSTMTFSNGSSIEVTTSGRSGTGNMLHISEFGYIAARRPDIAKEIMAGTLPGFHQGAIVFVESTAEGNGGQFFDMCQTAQGMKQTGQRLTEMDFKFHFYGFQDRAENSLTKEETAFVEIPNRLQLYFSELRAKEGVILTPEQKAWYTVQERTLQDDMKKEQPATPKEAFEASGEGMILAKQMKQAREDGRITEVPMVAGRPLLTFWDIGINDETSIAFMQNIGSAWNVVKYMEGSDDGMEDWIHRVRELASNKRWLMGDYVGPHDLKKRGAFNGEKLWDEIAAMGVRFKVVPKVDTKKVSITKLRSQFSLLKFDEKECEQLIKHLDNYRWDFDEVRGVFRDKPLHDPASNGADALQQWALHVDRMTQSTEGLAKGRPDSGGGRGTGSRMRGHM